MADPKLSGDVTGPDSQLGQLYDPDPDVVGKGTTVDKHPAQLVDLAILVQLGIWKNKKGGTNVSGSQSYVNFDDFPVFIHLDYLVKVIDFP